MSLTVPFGIGQTARPSFIAPRFSILILFHLVEIFGVSPQNLDGIKQRGVYRTVPAKVPVVDQRGRVSSSFANISGKIRWLWSSVMLRRISCPTDCPSFRLTSAVSHSACIKRHQTFLTYRRLLTLVMSVCKTPLFFLISRSFTPPPPKLHFWTAYLGLTRFPRFPARFMTRPIEFCFSFLRPCGLTKDFDVTRRFPFFSCFPTRGKGNAPKTFASEFR